MAVKELTSTQRTIALITVTALFIYAIVNAFLVIYAYAKLTKNVDQLVEYVDNWNSGVVIEVQAKATCDSGYEPMFTGRSWYGVNSGCYCGSGVTSANRDKFNITCSPFCSSSCSSTWTASGCSSVTGRSAQDIEYWGAASTTAYKICVKRSKETWGSQAPLINSDGTCPAGYTTCGTTDEYKFCTKESKCPITSFTWASATTCGGSNCIVVDNNVATGKTLSYTRSNDVGGDGLPIAEFRVNEYGMCDAKDTDDITPTRLNFALLKTKISTCNNEGGSLWNANADITYEDRLFTLHSLSSYITTLAPYTTSTMTGYYKTGKSGSDYQWKLFNRDYFPFKISCRDDMKSLITKMEALTNLKTAQTALLIIGLISTAVLGIALAYMEIQNLRGVDLSCIDGKGEEERQRLKKIKKYMTYAFKFLVIPFQIWAIALTGNTKGLFAKVGDNECSSTEVNVVMSYFGATLKSSYSSNITAIALTVVTLLVDILLALWDSRKAKKEAAKVATSPKEGNDKTQIINLENSSMNSPGKTPNDGSKGFPYMGHTVVKGLNQAPASQFASPGYPNSGGLTVEIRGAGAQPTQIPQQNYAQQAFPQQQAYPQQQAFPQQQAYPQQQFGQPQAYPQQQAFPQQQAYPQQQFAQPTVQQESGVQERSNPFAKR